MGCTSSAPSMLEVQTNKETTDSDKTSDTADCKDDDEQTVMKSNSELNNINDDEIAVLPTCDSLHENIQLDRNIKTLDSVLDQEEPVPDDQSQSVVEHENVESEISVEQQDHNKFSSLKEVADTVFLINILEEIENTTKANEEESLDEEKIAVADLEETSAEIEDASHGEELIVSKEKEECAEENSSPTQSDSNRSTRWEALADIAAELPPSLAVDPITGQIYSLSK